MCQNFNELFSENLVSLMRYRKLNQADLARCVGVSEAIVSSWVKGVKVPRMTNVDKICQVLGCERGDLIMERKQPHQMHERLLEYYLRLSPENKKQVDNMMQFLLAQQEEVKKKNSNG